MSTSAGCTSDVEPGSAPASWEVLPDLWASGVGVDGCSTLLGGRGVEVVDGWIPVLGVEGGRIIVGRGEVDRMASGWVSRFGPGAGHLAIAGAGMEGRGPGVTFVLDSRPIDAAMLHTQLLMLSSSCSTCCWRLNIWSTFLAKVLAPAQNDTN